MTKFACGSCYKPSTDRGIWPVIAATKPQFFLFMGDTVYADTEDMEVMRRKYGELTRQPGYAAFREEIPVLPIWDDHDYGRNDAGADYSQREASQKVFQDVFEFPADHPARATPGAYYSHTAGPEGKRLQVILLDTRYFRSALHRPRIKGRLSYVPTTTPGATMLGDDQWKWLEAELRKPADLRFIVSSIQIITADHRFEKWANIPAELQRLIDLLKSTGTNRAVLLSGDRHLAEFSRLSAKESGLSYDLVDFTSSGMTHAGAPIDTNRHRLGTVFSQINFGSIAIDWSNNLPVVTLSIHDFTGKPVQSQTVTFPK